MSPQGMIGWGYVITIVSCILAVLGILGSAYGPHLIRKGDNIKMEITINDFKKSQSDKVKKLIIESRRLNRPFIIVRFIKDKKTGLNYIMEKVGKKEIHFIFPVEIFNLGNFPATNIEVKTLTWGNRLFETLPRFNFYLEKSIDIYPQRMLKNRVKIVLTTESQKENFDLLKKEWIDMIAFNILYSPIDKGNERFCYFFQYRFPKKGNETILEVSKEMPLRNKGGDSDF